VSFTPNASLSIIFLSFNILKFSSATFNAFKIFVWALEKADKSIVISGFLK